MSFLLTQRTNCNMFDNHTGIFCFKYKVKLDNIINTVLNIAFDILLQLENKTTSNKDIELAVELFDDNLYKDLGIIKEDLLLKEKENENEDGDKNEGEDEIIYVYSKNDLFGQISTYYNDQLFNDVDILNFLEGSDIAFLQKEEKILYSFDKTGSEVIKRVKNAINNKNIINALIGYLKDLRIKSALNNIHKLNSPFLYGDVLELDKQSGVINHKYLSFDFLDTSKFELDKVDTDDIWLNRKTYKQKFKIVLPNLNDEQDYFVLKDKDHEIGIKINDIVLPFINANIIKYVKEDKRNFYYWSLIKDSFTTSENRKTNSSTLINDFISDSRRSDFAQLLSNLKKNLYIPADIEIFDSYKKYFRNYTYTEKLKFLEEYELYFPEHIDETGLCVYTNQKKEDEYNLLHWIEPKNPKQFSHYRKSIPEKIKRNLVSILKPEIAFYVLEKYFEDTVENILKEHDSSYIPNAVFTINNEKKWEVDFIIYSHTKNKIYFIEAKTKLNKEYIYSYIRKSSELEASLKNELGILDTEILNVEYVILAGFSDENVDAYQHFIESKEDYNNKRDGFFTLPYHFSIPISTIKDKNLTCIAEPEYDKLKKIITETCPK